MSRIPVLAPILALLGLALAPSVALAQAGPILYPAPETRRADWTFDLCDGASAARCLVRAVGDFNGDGIDDLAVERAPATAAGARGSTLGSPARLLQVYLGPLVDSAGHLVKPATAIEFSPLGQVASLTLVDLNGDGRQDLVLTGASRSTAVERQRVAVVYGRQDWPATLKLGAAAVGDVVVERARPVSPSSAPQPQRLAATFADLNGDGHLDLVLASDPPSLAADAARAPASQVAVMFGGPTWPTRANFRADVLISGLGRCRLGLGGVGDLTGDGLADIVLRQCTANLPDRPQLLAGRDIWPAEILLPGAADPAVLPPPGTPVPHPTRVPPAGGYVAADGSANGFGIFDPGPMMLLVDLTGDGRQDLAFEQGGRIHVFAGGPDIAERLAQGRSQGIILNAGLGAVPLSRAWQPVEAGGGARNLVLGRRPAPSPARHGRTPVDEPLALSAVALYADDLAALPVLDANRPTARSLRLPTTTTLWGLGDFNGDGLPDLLLGGNPTMPLTYQVVLGPLADGEAVLVPGESPVMP